MPLSIAVGLSRKAAQNYQSHGISIDLAAELDQTLLVRPDQLQQQIAALYAQAELALDCQAARLAGQQEWQAARQACSASGESGNGHGHNGNGHAVAAVASRATVSQCRVIHSIARRLNVDPGGVAQEVIGADLEQLTRQQASQLIGHLQSLESASSDPERR